ncbi:phage exclusion protein Lit family protein [Variovorax sp. V116]|uniref:phage exclusion protein Lit family protein n=1 Tax=Variovorax sp. V116 TaxID=3065953 RepID=UPI0034E8463B
MAQVQSTLASPVLVLEHNIIHAFENPHPGFVERLQRAVAEGQILPEIALRADLAPPDPPQTRGEPAEIHVHVTHLEVLWCSTYAWMVMYEEEVQKPAVAHEQGTTHSPDVQLITRAHQLLAWAESISDVYTPWPDGLPSPINWVSAAEEWYAQKANLVFQEAASFLLLHEWAHSTSLHLQQGPGLSDQDYIELEKDADNTAYDVLVGDREDDEKLHLAWAILSALLSSFYLLKTTSHVKQYRHPELHHRVQHMLFRLDIADERPRAYFHGLCVEVLRRTFTAALWSDPVDGYETAEELLQATLDQIDTMLDRTAATPLRRSPS